MSELIEHLRQGIRPPAGFMRAEELMNQAADEIEQVCEANESNEARRENEELRQWVNDLQSGMYINCVYCGHRYGPADEVAATMQEALYEHIAECPRHPLSKAKQELERLRAENDRLKAALERVISGEADIRWLTTWYELFGDVDGE